jgi:hypothetical protein
MVLWGCEDAELDVNVIELELQYMPFNGSTYYSVTIAILIHVFLIDSLYFLEVSLPKEISL